MVGLPGIADTHALGPYTSVGRIRLTDSEAMWGFLKAYKGRKIMWNEKALWHGIEKTIPERGLSKRVSAAHKLLKEYLLTKEYREDDLKRRLDGDWAKGYLVWKMDNGKAERQGEEALHQERSQRACSKRDCPAHVWGLPVHG